MQPRYREQIESLTPEQQIYLRQYFNLDPMNIYEALDRDGLCQADVVLALLRGNHTDAVGRLTTLQKIPGYTGTRWPRNTERKTEENEAQVRALRPPDYHSPRVSWLRRLRVGMSEQQILETGRRRWLRWALRRGYMELT